MNCDTRFFVFIYVVLTNLVSISLDYFFGPRYISQENIIRKIKHKSKFHLGYGINLRGTYSFNSFHLSPIHHHPETSQQIENVDQFTSS